MERHITHRFFHPEVSRGWRLLPFLVGLLSLMDYWSFPALAIYAHYLGTLHSPQRALSLSLMPLQIEGSKLCKLDEGFGNLHRKSRSHQ
jgi:hypothetical protein